jgi:hypothetical protein
LLCRSASGLRQKPKTHQRREAVGGFLRTYNRVLNQFRYRLTSTEGFEPRAPGALQHIQHIERFIRFISLSVNRNASRYTLIRANKSRTFFATVNTKDKKLHLTMAQEIKIGLIIGPLRDRKMKAEGHCQFIDILSDTVSAKPLTAR